jgi:hypothetical protein
MQVASALRAGDRDAGVAGLALERLAVRAGAGAVGAGDRELEIEVAQIWCDGGCIACRLKWQPSKPSTVKPS